MNRPSYEYYSVIRQRISTLDIQAAMSNVEKLIKSNPKDEYGYYFRGVCNFAFEKYNLAIRDYSLALKINPGFAKAYFNVGVCYYMIKYYDYALINIGKALFIFSKLREFENKQRCIEALELIESEKKS